MPSFKTLLPALLLLLCYSLSAEISQQRTDALKQQIYLDQAGFGPGYLDGKIGNFSREAKKNYFISIGNTLPDDEWVAHVNKTVKHPLVLVTVPSIVTEHVNPKLSKKKVTQATYKSLPYRSVGEFMAERYHTSESFLKEINGASKINNAKARTAILVPNVTPFKVESLAVGRSHKKQEALSTRYIFVDTVKKQLLIYSHEPTIQSVQIVTPEQQAVQEYATLPTLPSDKANDTDATTTKKADEAAVILTAQDPAAAGAVDQHETKPAVKEHKLIASFPITPGRENNIPYGRWTVKISIELPTWRYDKSLLETGKYGKESLNIPYGPNNPVGVMWNGLSKRGIGIHGTAEPTTIGRTTSSGCIRLSNWDVVKLPTYMRPGAIVMVK